MGAFRLPLLACVLMLISPGGARAEITITEAEYAGGVTVIRGEVERANARVTLDRRYKTRANRFGQFQFRVRYLPNDCVVDIRAGRDTHPVTIANCFLPGRGVNPMSDIPR